MSGIADKLVLKTALLAIEAMEALDEAVQDAGVGELYIGGTLLVRIDDETIGRVLFRDDFWQFELEAVS